VTPKMSMIRSPIAAVGGAPVPRGAGFPVPKKGKPNGSFGTGRPGVPFAFPMNGNGCFPMNGNGCFPMNGNGCFPINRGAFPFTNGRFVKIGPRVVYLGFPGVPLPLNLLINHAGGV